MTTQNVVNGSKVARIRTLNDQLRQNFCGQNGRVMLTSGVAALPEATRFKLFHAIQTFTEFSKDSDPHGEHDLVVVEVEGEKYFGKFDYYDIDMRYGADDPSDPEKTKRILTIMLASEY